MSYLTDLYKHCLEKPVHNHSRLGEYDLYNRSGKKFISYGLIKDFGEAEIFPLGDELPSSVEIYEWNYFCPSGAAGKFNSRILFTAQVRHINGRFLIEHFSINPNFSLLIKYKNEITCLYHDTSLDSVLPEYFNAYETEQMGPFKSENAIEFRLWSPPAGRVQVLLFDHEQKLIETASYIDLKRGEKGIWFGRFTGTEVPEIDNHEILYCQYLIYAYGEVKVALDPYAWSLASFNSSKDDKIGKAFLADRKKIKIQCSGFRNSMVLKDQTEMVAYEAHIRDFSVGSDLFGKEIIGTYQGFESNIRHINKCGFSHVQLMPVMKFYTVNESERAENAVFCCYANYNWGYDSHHFFSPEGWFSSDPDDPYARINELQHMADEIHANKLGLIYDVVYNHTYLSETLENVAPGWYCRFNESLMISGHTGAGAGLETRRPMTRKLIIDSLRHYIKFFGADGFRFDLVSFFDNETVEIIRKETGSFYNPDNISDLILHGEGWVFTDLGTGACTKLNPPVRQNNFALFNDCMRDGLIGHLMGTGLIHGDASGLPKLASAIAGGVKRYKPGAVSFNNPDFFSPYLLFSDEPGQTLNFVSVHDGFTLWDKINLTIFASRDEKIRRLCQAATVLFTSQGKVIWQGGEELLRTKPAGEYDREPWRTHGTDCAESFEGVRNYHENSFGAPDYTNKIRRDRPGAEKVTSYVSELIKLRKTLGYFTLSSSYEIYQKLNFIEPSVMNSEGAYLYSSFTELNRLTIRFKNGPAESRLFICGEVHPAGTDGNPVKNDFAVDFDQDGNGELTFSTDQVRSFDIGKWGSVNGLQIKLVGKAGVWNSPEYAYSPGGNNCLYPQAVTSENVITVDLAVKDFATAGYNEQKPYIAFWVDRKNNFSQYSKIVVIHNFSADELTIENRIFLDGEMILLADCNEVNERGVLSGYFKNNLDGSVCIAPNTSVIIGISERE